MKKYLILFAILLFAQIIQAQQTYKFNHILITNDDGIEDARRLIALAKSVKKVAKRVSIVVPKFDRSGTSNDMVWGKYQTTLEVTTEFIDKGNNIAMYAMPANPADCVLLGLSGFFADDRPDLVLSGINGGANIGYGWFGSGTIGAARTAAFLGVKAIALSGFENKEEKNLKAITDWTRKLISSEMVDEIGKDSYLTVGFPPISVEKVKGVKLFKRRISFEKPELIEFAKIHGGDPQEVDSTTVWVISPKGNPIATNIEYDDTLLLQGYVIITPMTINENDKTLLDKLKKTEQKIPKFN